MKWAQSRSILWALWKEPAGVCACVCLSGCLSPPWQLWWAAARREDGAGVHWWALSWANTYYHHFNWRLVEGFSCRVCREADSSWCWHNSLWAWLRIFLCSMWRKTNRKRIYSGDCWGYSSSSSSQKRRDRMKWQFQLWCKKGFPFDKVTGDIISLDCHGLDAGYCI